MSVKRMMLLEPDAQDAVACAAEALAGPDSPEEGICALLAQVNAFLHTEAVSVFGVDEATQEVVLYYADSPDADQVIGLRMPFGQGVVGWVIRYNEDLLVPSTCVDPRFFSGVDQQTGYVTRCILCAPIARAGQAVGAIEALNKTTGHFNDNDVLFLLEIAEVIAASSLVL
jgi:signal transduction protein with GAF and PtsI domain